MSSGTLITALSLFSAIKAPPIRLFLLTALPPMRRWVPLSPLELWPLAGFDLLKHSLKIVKGERRPPRRFFF